MNLTKLKDLKVLTLVLLVVIVIGAGVAIALTTRTPTAKPQPSSATPAPAVVEITASGFVPETVSVSPNTTVIWVNEDAAPHLPAADPYPTHASLPSLVAPKALGQKETYSYTFTKAGTAHYHDDLNPTFEGVVEVR